MADHRSGVLLKLVGTYAVLAMAAVALLPAPPLAGQEDPLPPRPGVWEGIPDLPCIAGDCFAGVGIAASPDGAKRYLGEWGGGVPHGYGRLFQVDIASGHRPPPARRIEAEFEWGNLSSEPRILWLGPDAPAPEGLQPLTFAGRAMEHALLARWMLPEDSPGHTTLRLAAAEAELERAKSERHAALAGGQPERLRTARVHARLAALQAELLGETGTDLRERAEALLKILYRDRM